MSSNELVPALPEPLEGRNAFELLSKPTLELSDEDVTLICADLRKKREAFLQGIADKPQRKPAAAKAIPDRSDEAKKARTQNLLLDIDLGEI